MCVCVERERERERENCIYSRTYQPKIHLSVLQTVCVRIFRFMIPESEDGLFSLFYLVALVLPFVCLLFFSWMDYLVCFILFCFAFCLFVVLFVDAPPINQDNKKKCQRTIFLSYIISFKNRVQTHIFNKTDGSTKLAHYDTRTPLFCLRLLMSFWIKDTRTPLFCLRLLKSRLLVQKSFWIKDRTKFLQKQCTVCAAFADADVIS